MADITLSVKHEAKITKAFKLMPGEMGKALADAIEQSAVFLTGKVKEHITLGTKMWKSPIDTGALRRHIHPVFERGRAFIRPGTITPYATYVHEGTGFMRARPFFAITAEMETKSVNKFALGIIERAIKKILP